MSLAEAHRLSQPKPIPERPRLTIAGLPDFWTRVRGATHRLLAIDYDGTIAPFRIDRERATPVEGVKELLCTIRDHPATRLAILTGRPAYQVIELMGSDLQIPVFGAHGWEKVYPDGRVESFNPADVQQQGLAQAIAIAVDAGYEANLERKTASVALHTRAFEYPDEIEARFLELWRPLLEPYRLAIMHFNRGVEVRAEGHNKGVALADLYQQMPPETLPVYIGDDTTDEDAFRYVKPFGIGIKVGTEGPTDAAGRVPDPAAVLHLLEDWVTETIRLPEQGKEPAWRKIPGA